MKKILVFIIFMFTNLNCFAVSNNWLQIDNKIYIDINNTKFIQNTNYSQALVEFKILNDNYFPNINNKKVWYGQGMYLLNCFDGCIDTGAVKYYDLNNIFLINKKINLKLPATHYEKIIYNYVCITKRNQMLSLENELKNINNYNLKNRQINALEEISDELYFLNNQ